MRMRSRHKGDGPSAGGAVVTPARGLDAERGLTDPERLAEVHENVRDKGPLRPKPSPSGSRQRSPWVDPANGEGGTAELLFKQAHKFLNERSFARPTAKNTTDANLDSDAVAMHRRLLDRFPQITAPLSEAEIEKRVGLVQPSTVAKEPGFLNAWMDNNLHQMTESENFDIDTANPDYRAMIEQLINDPEVGSKILTLAARHSAFAGGQGPNRRIFVHLRVTDSARQTTLIHELVHLYRHPRYRDWVKASRDARHYEEGMTEWLARKAMTSEELDERTSYQARVDTVQDQIARHVSEDGIARAYFLGEVWRLETRSAEARAAFEATTGIGEAAGDRAQRAASRAGPGLFQTVVPNAHFRFLNLGFGEAEPKAEHEAAFRSVKSRTLDRDPELKLRFVGHASSPGSEAANLALSRRRATAFYRMARREGLPATRMIDAERPPHFGESTPTVTEDDAITRAMNRRVEMFLIRGGTP